MHVMESNVKTFSRRCSNWNEHCANSTAFESCRTMNDFKCPHRRVQVDGLEVVQVVTDVMRGTTRHCGCARATRNFHSSSTADCNGKQQSIPSQLLHKRSP